MKAAVARSYGSPKVIKVETIEKPQPQPNEVLVKVSVASISRADTMMRTGKPYIGRLFIGLIQPKQAILGTGFSGEVVAIGDDVIQFSVGDEVFGETLFGCGSNAEYLCIAQDELIVKRPVSLSASKTASVCDGALTSYNFLKKIAQVKAGQHVLINGASGSLGMAAIQIAKHLGAIVTAVCSRDNFHLVKELGADYLINYRQDNFYQQNKCYDVIYDAVGKSSFAHCKKVLTEKGVYMTPVLNFYQLLPMFYLSLFSKKRTVFSATGMLSPKILREMVNELTVLFESRALRTVIDREYKLEEINQAHEYIDSGRKKGNVILVFNH
jgi:NADPH:quinone reductase-like Zn-dependent oxidoreductase